MATKHKTREDWLNEAVALLCPWFKDNGGYRVPGNLKVTCGFPSRLALSSKRQRIGECWADSASEGKTFEIFISPVLSDPARVLDTLAHEIVHAVVGLDAGHKGPFKKCATDIGLEGRMTSTVAGQRLGAHLRDIAKKLATYPHTRLNVSNRTKKGGTRLVKCECPKCGYVARVTRVWLEVGAPICPADRISLEIDA